MQNEPKGIVATAALGDVPLWERLVAPASAPLRAAAAAADPTRAADVARLRRDWPADLVRAAIELNNARRRAAAKFPHAERLVADVAGVEQATDHLVATHKTRRVARLAGGRGLVDLCCGIGGDAMAFAADPAVELIEVIDRDPLRTWMAGRNADAPARCADVETLEFAPETVFHLDPARRIELPGGPPLRRYHLADYQPGPAFIEQLLARCSAGLVKLGPGVDLDALPRGGDAEIELISRDGRLVQAVLWWGALADRAGRRTATRLPDGISVSGVPDSAPAPIAKEIGGRLFIPDPALERTRLVGQVAAPLELQELHPGLGLLTGDASRASPWLRGFDVHATMPWRAARVRRWLVAHDAGIVTVRTRDRAVDTDRTQRELRGKGDVPYTVFALRLGAKRVAIVTRPMPSGDATDRD